MAARYHCRTKYLHLAPTEGRSNYPECKEQSHWSDYSIASSDAISNWTTTNGWLLPFSCTNGGQTRRHGCTSNRRTSRIRHQSTADRSATWCSPDGTIADSRHIATSDGTISPFCHNSSNVARSLLDARCPTSKSPAGKSRNFFVKTARISKQIILTSYGSFGPLDDLLALGWLTAVSAMPFLAEHRRQCQTPDLSELPWVHFRW